MQHFSTILIVLGLAATSFWLALLPDSQLGNVASVTWNEFRLTLVTHKN